MANNMIGRTHVRVVEEKPLQQRKQRRPVHTFALKQRPWQIQPFLLAPVLPGETLDNMLLQARVVSDPLIGNLGPLIGWWCEQYTFYVSHRMLGDTWRAALQAMVLTNASTAALNSAAQVETYHQAGTPDFAQMCLQRVTEEYFRNEGEAWNVAMIGNLPVASIGHDNAWESLVDGTPAPPAANIFQDEPDPSVISAYQNQYDRMRQMRATNLTYADWLHTYGVSVNEPEAENENQYKPELVRYSRDWTYPTNTIDPATGTPTSAASWSIQERADKNRYFKEPGFLFGVQVIRPKVYFGNQGGCMANQLNDALSWLPAVLSDEPYTSIRNYAAGNNGPLDATTTGGYWLDLRDLYLHGDQFLNFSRASTGYGGVSLPLASNLQHRFANAADADSLFKTPATANTIRTDGVVNLNIRSKVPFASDFT